MRRCPPFRRWGVHDPPRVHDHRGRAAGRRGASCQRAGIAADRDQDAYSRLTPMTKLNAVTPLPLVDPNNSPMPFMDPAFTVAICRYDLSTGPIKLAVPVSQAYTSVSFYSRNEVAYYAITDRSAGRKVIELD